MKADERGVTGCASAAAIRALFFERSRHQSWLDVEAALARCQAELGMIPEGAARVIAESACLDKLDELAFQRLTRRTRAPVLALVETLAQACGAEAGGYVHWGATTQNIIQTARVVQMQCAHRALKCRLASIFGKLAGLAEQGAEMPCAGRTNRRQAVPITFGFKVAGWIDEMLRHEDRLVGAEGRVFVSQFGGAIGAMHAFGVHGTALNAAVSQRLGLAPALFPMRSSLDRVAEYIQLLALLGTTCSRVANEFYGLMADEVGEAFEVLDGAVGSSTMPQKVNSKIAVRIIAQATRLRGYAVMALDAMQPSHEADASANLVIYSVIDEAVPLAYELICLFDELLSSVRLVPENMRRNLALSDGLIVAEKAMMLLAPVVGRNRAHHVVRECTQRVQQDGHHFAQVLAAHPGLPRELAGSDFAAALTPEQYLGESVPMSREAASLARAASLRLSPERDPGPAQAKR